MDLLDPSQFDIVWDQGDPEVPIDQISRPIAPTVRWRSGPTPDHYQCYSAMVQNEKSEVIMSPTMTPSTVKMIGANGQISLGKKYAGRQVLVEEHAPGVWLVRTVTIVPDNEYWLQAPAAVADLERALAWAANNPADDANLNQLLVKLADD